MQTWGERANDRVIFFFSSHYNETTLKEMILLENLLYFQQQSHTTHIIHPLFCTDGSRKGHLLLKV